MSDSPARGPLGNVDPTATGGVSPQMLDYAPTAERWKVGTLTYTQAGLAILFCLLLWGDFAYSMKERSAAPMLQILVKQVFHSSNTEMQMFMVFIPNAIGILLGPIISYRSDRHRGRWGRRIPYLMVSTPFAVLAMIGIGFSPAMGRSLHEHLGHHSLGLDPTIRMFLGFFWVIFEVATVAANAVFGALVNDVVPHQIIGRFFGLFRALSLIAGMVVNWSLIGLTEYHYRAIFLGVGLLYGFGFTLMCLTVKEGQYPPPRSSEVLEKTGFFHACGIYLHECFSNPYYIWLMLAMMLGGLTFMPVNNFSQPFATALHIDNFAYGKYIAATYAISLALSYWIGSLADRFHPLRIGIAAMLLYAAVTLWGGFSSANAHVLFKVPLPSGAVPIQLYGIALIAHGVLSGTYFTCTASLGQRLFPRSRFAQFASAAAIVGAISNMIFAKVTGYYFDAHGPVYQRTYLMGCGLALAAAVMMFVVHTYFMRLGGTREYVAP